jgi:hypothetical protein
MVFLLAKAFHHSVTLRGSPGRLPRTDNAHDRPPVACSGGGTSLPACPEGRQHTEHQLNDPDIDAVGEQPARAFVPQVVPAEVDPLELLTIPLRTLPR